MSEKYARPNKVQSVVKNGKSKICAGVSVPFLNLTVSQDVVSKLGQKGEF